VIDPCHEDKSNFEEWKKMFKTYRGVRMTEDAYNNLSRKNEQDIKNKALIRLEQLRIALDIPNWDNRLIFREQALEAITRNIKVKG
jgi:hypothetical protein